MDSWILGLRADEDVQLEYRALLGPSIRTIGRVEVHAFEASSREAAARIFDSAAASLGYGTAAVACDEPSVHEDGAEVLPAIERVVALCMTAAPGEFTFTLQAARALSTALCFARARRRPGWRLPFACASLAEVPRLRSACRESAAKLPERPAFVDRADELDAVIDALGDGATTGFAVIRASGRMGSTRLVHEAAARVGARVIRRVYEGDAVVVSAIDEVLRGVSDDTPRWLLVEARDAQRLDVDVASITVGRAAVLAIVGPDCDTPWCPPLREVELGPLAPAESRSIVRSLLGDATEDMLVSRFARRSSVPGRLVELVRAAALSGEVIFDPISNTWHHARDASCGSPAARARHRVRTPHRLARRSHATRCSKWPSPWATGPRSTRYAASFAWSSAPSTSCARCKHTASWRCRAAPSTSVEGRTLRSIRS
ncbi:MAG: hypothetical protein U0326_43175 [Polyangiales bacterium]